MLLDALDQRNYITVNTRAVQLFGLNAAFYLTELFTIYTKAKDRGKLVDDHFFKIDRKYVTSRTSLSSEEQLICDANLIKTGVMQKNSDDPDIIKINPNQYLSLLASEDVKLIEDIKKQMKIVKPKGVKASQRQIVINNLKNGIVCSNYELLTALRDWVDGIYANPKGFLSKTAIKVFQDTLNNYTKGDLDVALRIVQIATIQGYKNCDWAIKIYEESQKRGVTKGVRVTQQEVAQENDLSDIAF